MNKIESGVENIQFFCVNVEFFFCKLTMYDSDNVIFTKEQQ